MKKVLCYIDDSESDIIPFVIKMDGTELFETTYIQVTDEMTLKDLLQQLESRHFDCLVVDYFLKQGARVNFQGDDLVAAYQAKYPKFPIMMLSNKDDGAIEDAENIDVMLIRSKQSYTKTPDVFIALLQKIIENYKGSLASASKELEELKQKDSGGALDALEEERLVELDAFLDESLDSSNKIPNTVRVSSNAKRLDTLIERADQIIEKLKSKNA